MDGLKEKLMGLKSQLEEAIAMCEETHDEDSEDAAEESFDSQEFDSKKASKDMATRGLRKALANA